MKNKHVKQLAKSSKTVLSSAHRIEKPTTSVGFLLLKWCGPGSNRRHKDFQSFALPTELPHHSCSPMKGERGANIRTCGFIQILSTKFFLFELFSSFYQLHIPCHYHSNLILTNFSAPVELIRA